MRRTVIVPVAAMLVALAACAGMMKTDAERKAKIEAARNAAYDVPRDQVMHVVLNTLVRKEYPIERQNETTGIFETNWVSRSMYGAQHRVRVIAQVLGSGPYRVNIQAEVMSQEAISARPFENELYLTVYEQLTGE